MPIKTIDSTSLVLVVIIGYWLNIKINIADLNISTWQIYNLNVDIGPGIQGCRSKFTLIHFTINNF